MIRDSSSAYFHDGSWRVCGKPDESRTRYVDVWKERHIRLYVQEPQLAAPPVRGQCSTCSRALASISVVTQHTFAGVRLSVPTAFGVVATSWPFARISIGEDGVDLISTFPLRSEWYSPLDVIDSVKADGQRFRFGRTDGSTACFRVFSWRHDVLVSALVECGLRVEHVDKVA